MAAESRTVPGYSLAEEIASSITHGLGILLAIAGLAVLCAMAALDGQAVHVVACAIFGATTILCFTASTLYHAIPIQRIKPLLRALDHSAIFLLIAGTYTPVLLITVGATLGWAMLVFIWSCAVLGIVLRIVLAGRLHNLIVLCYLAMGWSVLAILGPLVQRLETGGLALLAAGGLVYTAGVAFYKWRSLRFNHAIWHVFVLTGCALHYFAVLLYILPAPLAAQA